MGNTFTQTLSILFPDRVKSLKKQDIQAEITETLIFAVGGSVVLYAIYRWTTNK